MQDPRPHSDVSASLALPATLESTVRTLAVAFRDAGLETPELDARRLVLDTLSLDNTALLRDPDRHLSADERQRIAGHQSRRLAREPVSRILGQRAFHGLDLEITPATLDPRPDTETLVDGVLQLVAEGRVSGGEAPRILDVGTGSGAILIALLHRLPKASGLGTDISEAALTVAKRNAARHGLAARASFREARWLDGIDGSFDLIVSNPPYIPSGIVAELEPEVARFDPVAALDGGADGLVAYRAIAGDVRRLLTPGGWIAVEVGIGQSQDVASILAAGLGDRQHDRAGDTLIWLDLGGIPRCVAREARD